MRLTHEQGRIFTEEPEIPGAPRKFAGARWWMWVILGIIVALCTTAVTALPAEPDVDWKRNIALGMNLTSGNTDTSLYTTDLSAKKKGTANEFDISGQFSYGEADNEKTEEHGKLEGQYNRLLTDRSYIYVNSGYSYDNIALLDYRFAAGPGWGHYLIKSADHSLSMEIGASFLSEKSDLPADTAASVDAREDTIVARVVQKYNIALSKTARIWQSAEYLAHADDTDIYFLNAELGLEAAINSQFSLRLTIKERYDSDPPPEVKKRDIATAVSLVCNL